MPKRKPNPRKITVTLSASDGKNKYKKVCRVDAAKLNKSVHEAEQAAQTKLHVRALLMWSSYLERALSACRYNSLLQPIVPYHRLHELHQQK